MAGDAPRKPTLIPFGPLGVNIDADPLVMPDGSWRRLVNGERAVTNTRTRGTALGGIRKRGGLTPITEDLGGAILAAAGVPLPSELDFSPRLVVAMNTGAGSSSAWKSSVDGSTFVDIPAATLPRCYQNRNWAGVSISQERPPRAALYRRNLYFPSNDYTEANPPNDPPPLALLTAQGQGYNVLDIPNAIGSSNADILIGDTLGVNDTIYMAMWQSSGTGRVMAFDPRFGTLSQVGAALAPPSGSGMSLAWYQNRLWVGTFAIPGTARGYIYSIRPGYDTTWTLERTSAADNGGYHQLIVYNDRLYACTDADAIGTALIEQRTAAGVWSTSFTAPSNNTSRFSGAVVFDGKLYVGWYRWASTTACLIKAFDGSSWTTDLDVKSTYAFKAPGQPVVFDDALYWPTCDMTDATSATNFLMKRTAAGVWSQPLTNVALQGTAAVYYPAPGY